MDEQNIGSKDIRETRLLSIGTKDTLLWEISSVQTFLSNIEYWMSVQEIQVLNLNDKGMSEEMFDDGYENITNIDISQTSIKKMNEEFKEKGPNFKYIQMDVRAM